MGHSDNEKDCDLKHRIIPKLTPDKSDKKKDSKSVDEVTKQETPEERIARINNVQISFSDFFVKCLDHEMLKLFFGSLFAFFMLVGFATVVYLIFIYFFQPRLWNIYFPSEEMHRHAHGEF